MTNCPNVRGLALIKRDNGIDITTIKIIKKYKQTVSKFQESCQNYSYTKCQQMLKNEKYHFQERNTTLKYRHEQPCIKIIEPVQFEFVAVGIDPKSSVSVILTRRAGVIFYTSLVFLSLIHVFEALVITIEALPTSLFTTR